MVYLQSTVGEVLSGMARRFRASGSGVDKGVKRLAPVKPDYSGLSPEGAVVVQAKAKALSIQKPATSFVGKAKLLAHDLFSSTEKILYSAKVATAGGLAAVIVHSGLKYGSGQGLLEVLTSPVARQAAQSSAKTLAERSYEGFTLLTQAISQAFTRQPSTALLEPVSSSLKLSETTAHLGKTLSNVIQFDKPLLSQGALRPLLQSFLDEKQYQQPGAAGLVKHCVSAIDRSGGAYLLSMIKAPAKMLQSTSMEQVRDIALRNCFADYMDKPVKAFVEHCVSEGSEAGCIASIKL